MLSLIKFNLPILVAAVLIGLVTARWMFRRPPAPPEPTESIEAP
ncbi:MAG TPA: hypothetical protein VF704_03935 [Allosphingosinicella sp.]|jgi:hypothetical protein